MNKLLVPVVLLAIGIFAWNLAAAKPPALQTYEAFANSVLRGQHQTALAYTEGSNFAAMFATRGSRHTFLPRTMETFRGAVYEYETLGTAPHRLDLMVTQTVTYTLPGYEAAPIGTMMDRFAHRVTLKRRGADWKITFFESTPLGRSEAN